MNIVFGVKLKKLAFGINCETTLKRLDKEAPDKDAKKESPSPKKKYPTGFQPNPKPEEEEAKKEAPAPHGATAAPRRRPRHRRGDK